MLIVSKKFREETQEPLKLDSMMMGGVVLENAEKEKYLGDWVHEKGCRENISANTKNRMQKQIGKCKEIIQIAETLFLNAVGNATTEIKYSKPR